MECTTISQNDEEINVAKLFTEVIVINGKQMQTDVAMEEMGELIQALVKYRRNKSRENLNHIIEEIADVQIMLDQLKLMYDFGNEVPKVQAAKLERLKDNIKSEISN